MLKKLCLSLKNIDYKMLFSLIFLGFCPSVYTTLRVFFLGRLPQTGAYSIAGQLSWLNLIYEILREAIILPLFFFMGKAQTDKKEFANRVKSGLFLTFFIYSVFASIIIFCAKPLLLLMAADKNIIDASAEYIKIESAAYIFGTLEAFALVALISLGKSSYLYILTLSKLALCIICDTFFISTLPFSLNAGVNGIGWSNLITDAFLFIISVFLLSKNGISVFDKNKISFSWTRDFFRIGGISGLESLVRNLAYMLMIVRMVNVVNEQGLYWVANGFIWGWLLLPVTQLGELIKKDTAADKNNIQKKISGYFILTAFICLLWAVSIPLWKPFMKEILGYADTDRLFRLVLLLIGFYVLYSFQNIFDAVFYGLGKTHYMLSESVITNLIYYGTFFILYISGHWQPSLTGIALLFGGGIAFDSVVSFAAFVFMLRKEKINIFN